MEDHDGQPPVLSNQPTPPPASGPSLRRQTAVAGGAVSLVVIVTTAVVWGLETFFHRLDWNLLALILLGGGGSIWAFRLIHKRRLWVGFLLYVAVVIIALAVLWILFMLVLLVGLWIGRNQFPKSAMATPHEQAAPSRHVAQRVA